MVLSLVWYQTHQSQRTVVVYTSVDQVYSEPVLKEFERRSGIRVLAVYDVEATKTIGLVNRLIAEKSHPQADVFWNAEPVNTLVLKREHVLAPFRSSGASDIPAQYVDSEGYWVGIGGRARVLLVNTNLVSKADYPKSIFDLAVAKWSGGDISIAYPMFGTTATEAAALYAALGCEKVKDFYSQLKSKGVRVVDGNSVVRDLVAGGQVKMGLTDTDDACVALRSGAPVALVFLDQGVGDLGALIFPNTVTLIANGPHQDEGRRLIDYLASREIEEQLVLSSYIQVPVRPIGAQPNCPPSTIVKGMSVSLEEIFVQLEASRKDLSEIFIQ